MTFPATDPRTDELVERARRFAYDTLRPHAARADRLAPHEVDNSEVLREASRLGLRTVTLDESLGGAGADCLTEIRLLEEIAAGDAGFAMTIAHCWREGAALARFATPSARERLLPEFLADDTYVTSWAITEPHSGSDHTTRFEATLEAGPQTSAVLDGEEWVIDGQKCFITNAPSSKLIIVFARTDASVPWTRGISAFLVHRDTPGVTSRGLEDKLGLRVNQNGELHFSQVRVPRDQLLGELHGGIALLHEAGAGSRAREAARSIGVARAAYELAAEYVSGRVQGGAPIGQHSVVRAALTDMLMEIELARSLTWRAAWAVQHAPQSASRLESLAKVYASEMGARVTSQALQLFGHRGLLRENPVEKLVRDAVSLLPPPVGNHALRSAIGAELVAEAAR